MGLKEEIKQFVLDTFGEYSAEKIDLFANEINPDLDPKGFLDKCVSFLSTMLGEEVAKAKLKPYFDKYCNN